MINNSKKTVDSIKQYNLENLVRATAKPGFKYFELHAGQGCSFNGEKCYDGSLMKILDILEESFSTDYQAFFNESDDEKRRKIAKGLFTRRSITINGMWENHITEYLKISNENSLFVFNPKYIADYEQLLCYFTDILNTGAKAFLNVSQNPALPKHKKIVNNIKELIANRHRKNRRYRRMQTTAKDNSGKERIYHNVIVCDDVEILDMLEQRHKTLLNYIEITT